MPRLIWTPQALQDLTRLHAFVAGKNVDAARRAVGAIREGARLLEQHPHAGRPLEGMEPEFREWLVEFGGRGYVMAYRFDGGDAVVLAVRHTREAGY